mgnify:FL=1
MDHDYTVKVYADAVESGIRELETIPTDYRKDVEAELWRREKTR